MAKLIVAAPPIPGEVGPMLQIAQALAARGHQITVLTGSSFRQAAESAGLAFAPLTGAADYDIREIIAERDKAGVASGTPDELNFDWIHAFVNSMPQQHRDLQKLLDQDPDQYLISNVLFLGALPVRQGAPGRRPLS
jgi:UDP:flavonoid glycosyltransferase YjiC (YdhE family)